MQENLPMDKQFQLVVMLHNLKDQAKLVGMMLSGRGVTHTESDIDIANSDLLWREAEILAFFDQCLAEQGRGGEGLKAKTPNQQISTMDGWTLVSIGNLD